MQAEQIVFCARQTRFCVLLSEAKPRNTGGFLKDFASIIAAGSHNGVYFPLPNHGIPIAPEAGVEKQLGYIAQAHGGMIQPVFTFTGAIIPAGDGHLIAVKGKLSIAVVNGQRHLRKALRLSVWCTVEDQPLHARAAERSCRLFAKNPADGICYVAFSAAVWPHHGCDTIVKGEQRFIGKRLEPL